MALEMIQSKVGLVQSNFMTIFGNGNMDEFVLFILCRLVIVCCFQSQLITASFNVSVMRKNLGVRV